MLKKRREEEKRRREEKACSATARTKLVRTPLLEDEVSTKQTAPGNFKLTDSTNADRQRQEEGTQTNGKQIN